MKRSVSCTLTALAASVILLLTAMPGAQTEAASPVETAQRNMLEEDHTQADGQHMAEDPINAKELRKIRDAGFIALSESTMNWGDARAFCQKYGGRLPRINKRVSWDGENPPLMDIRIDGFGYAGIPWRRIGLPDGNYWTRALRPDRPARAWVVRGFGGAVGVNDRDRGGSARVVCVK